MQLDHVQTLPRQELDAARSETKRLQAELDAARSAPGAVPPNEAQLWETMGFFHPTWGHF